MRWRRLIGQSALLVITWATIFEIGLRMQQYFGPLYDLEMANVDLNWESDVLNHKPEPENQNLCIYGDLTGFNYKRSYDANGIRIIDDKELLAECRNPISSCFSAIPLWRATTTRTRCRIVLPRRHKSLPEQLLLAK